MISFNARNNLDHDNFPVKHIAEGIFLYLSLLASEGSYASYPTSVGNQDLSEESREVSRGLETPA